MDIQEATPIKLTAEERSALEAMIRSPKTEHVLVERARIVLLAAQFDPLDSGRTGHLAGPGEPLADAFCAPPPGRAARPAAARTSSALHCRNRQAHPGAARSAAAFGLRPLDGTAAVARAGDRKSTRLHSSHV